MWRWRSPHRSARQIPPGAERIRSVSARERKSRFRPAAGSLRSSIAARASSMFSSEPHARKEPIASAARCDTPGRDASAKRRPKRSVPSPRRVRAAARYSVEARPPGSAAASARSAAATRLFVTAGAGGTRDAAGNGGHRAASPSPRLYGRTGPIDSATDAPGKGRRRSARRCSRSAGARRRAPVPPGSHGEANGLLARLGRGPARDGGSRPLRRSEASASFRRAGSPPEPALVGAGLGARERSVPGGDSDRRFPPRACRASSLSSSRPPRRFSSSAGSFRADSSRRPRRRSSSRFCSCDLRCSSRPPRGPCSRVSAAFSRSSRGFSSRSVPGGGRSGPRFSPERRSSF